VASKKRTINKVIIKGYETFPKSFIKHYFNIKKETVFNQQKITTISNASKNLQFITEIKPPEVLFTKDSTVLYIYVKKNQNNSFDGLVNFASEENGSVLFNGHIDLKLNNVLNTGENFELFWNSIGNERQEFKLSTEIPYLFNTVITPKISFSIYKQDSTFLNTKFNSKLFYNINPKTKLGFTYSSENSENLGESINNNIQTYSNYFLGFQFQYRRPKRDFFFNDTFYIEINPSIGKRKTENTAVNQFKIEATASYIWDLTPRSSIFIQNKTEHLNSDIFIDNEIFRIGGANSIRGFNEQSIFTNSYTLFNLEYRFLTSQKSYFYSITDFGDIKTSLKKETLLGIGLGYLFTTKNSQINLSTAIGKSSSQDFDFKNSKLIISWKSFF
jgi:hemolysin activation/secretion protein